MNDSFHSILFGLILWMNVDEKDGDCDRRRSMEYYVRMNRLSLVTVSGNLDNSNRLSVAFSALPVLSLVFRNTDETAECPSQQTLQMH